MIEESDSVGTGLMRSTKRIKHEHDCDVLSSLSLSSFSLALSYSSVSLENLEETQTHTGSSGLLLLYMIRNMVSA